MNSVATMRTAPPRPKALADGKEHANPDEESCLLTFVTDSRANKVRGRETRLVASCYSAPPSPASPSTCLGGYVGCTLPPRRESLPWSRPRVQGERMLVH